MDRQEQRKFGSDQRPETEEKKEAPVVQESPKVLEDRMLKQAAIEVASFREEGARRLETAETRATSEKLAIDDANKDELSKLNQEVENAQRDLSHDLEDNSQTQPETEEGSPQAPPPIPQVLTKEKELISPEQLQAKEASKKMLAEERRQLAEQILKERRENRDRMLELKNRLDLLRKNLSSIEADWEGGQKSYEELCSLRSQQADSFAGRVKRMLNKVGVEFESDKQVDQSIEETAEKIQRLAEKKSALEEESESLTNLLESDSVLTEIKSQLADHYGKAEQMSQRHFEHQQKTVEQTMLRNNAFIVHTLQTLEDARHNANSNISNRATLEDDMDILLSLEPSISTSSVVPGSKQGLWSQGIGVVLGGGDIMGIFKSDDGTITGGIKKHSGRISSSKEIDEGVSDKRDRTHYNELVVNSPKVFGFFKNIGLDESGNMTIPGLFDNNERKGDDFIKREKDSFIEYMSIGEKKGLPLLVMTPDRRLFEFVSISEDGFVSVGSEITPEQVAKGRAGLPEEKRREIGEKIITKNLFRNIRDQQEAKGIIAELSGQDNAKAELSKEEYVAYAKDNPHGLLDFPKHLFSDKTFMMEIAQYNPAETYRLAGENLKKDIGFIKHIYSLQKDGIAVELYGSMPEALRKDESIAILAIENNDFNGKLGISLADSPVIWEKIIDKIVEKRNPDQLFSGDVKNGIEEGQIGDKRVVETRLRMRTDEGNTVDLSKRLISDNNLIRKFNERYPSYRFEVDPRQQIVVTKLA